MLKPGIFLAIFASGRESYNVFESSRRGGSARSSARTSAAARRSPRAPRGACPRWTRGMNVHWTEKRREYEEKKASAKAYRACHCAICGKQCKSKCSGCASAAYCSTACQRIDWRDRGHRAACKKLQDERAAEAARAEAPTPAPEEVFYGPAPRSRADEARARIAIEQKAARAWREANPAPKPLSARFGSRCPICLENWVILVDREIVMFSCCCQKVCRPCCNKIPFESGSSSQSCPFCRVLTTQSHREELARIRRHVENAVPEAITQLGSAYRAGSYGLVKSSKKAAKLYKRAVELGDVDAMVHLGNLYVDTTPTGIKLDRKKAARLYRMAADRGHIAAQCHLALNPDRSCDSDSDSDSDSSG